MRVMVIIFHIISNKRNQQRQQRRRVLSGCDCERACVGNIFGARRVKSEDLSAERDNEAGTRCVPYRTPLPGIEFWEIELLRTRLWSGAEKRYWSTRKVWKASDGASFKRFSRRAFQTMLLCKEQKHLLIFKSTKLSVVCHPKVGGQLLRWTWGVEGTDGINRTKQDPNRWEHTHTLFNPHRQLLPKSQSRCLASRQSVHQNRRRRSTTLVCGLT